jgi:hypothetical protein
MGAAYLNCQAGKVVDVELKLVRQRGAGGLGGGLKVIEYADSESLALRFAHGLDCK